MPYKDKEKERERCRIRGRTESYKAYQRKYRLLHPVKDKEIGRLATARWRERNPEKAKLACRNSYKKLKKNPTAYARYLKILRDQRRQRYQIDDIFRIYCNARSKITTALIRGRNQKRGTTQELLGCTILELKIHLESQFVDGMSWDNKSEWHIDHIRSCVSFDLSNPDEMKKCFHYSNLRPIWSKDNREKWAHFEGYHHNSVRYRSRNEIGQFLPND